MELWRFWKRMKLGKFNWMMIDYEIVDGMVHTTPPNHHRARVQAVHNYYDGHSMVYHWHRIIDT